jgi:hypothetical protein
MAEHISTVIAVALYACGMLTTANWLVYITDNLRSRYETARIAGIISIVILWPVFTIYVTIKVARGLRQHYSRKDQS